MDISQGLKNRLAAIQPFATKKSHLASDPFSGQFGDWKLPFS